MNDAILAGAYLLLLVAFLALELTRRVPATRNAVMLALNGAIAGVAVIGGIVLLAAVDSTGLRVIGFLAVALGAGSLVGGLAVTDRLLARTPRPSARDRDGATR